MEKVWTEKYRPTTLDEYVFESEQHRNYVSKIIKSKDIPNLLLTGSPGCGKTSLSKMLANLCEVDPADTLIENASNKTGIDYIRDTILNFAATYPIGDFKLVRFEEVGYLSPNAQGMLRDVLEASSDTCRFIFTANEEHKIIPAIKSRIHHLRFKAPSRDDTIVKAATILLTESVTFDPAILDKFVDIYYPDLRKLINSLQQFTIDGQLHEPGLGDAGGQRFQLLEMLDRGDLLGFTKGVLDTVPSEQYVEIFELLYRNLRRVPACKAADKYEAALVTLADGLYKHSLVAIPELNMEATLIKVVHAIG